jgi:N-sulfoglucosamine sulfohydrolase
MQGRRSLQVLFLSSVVLTSIACGSREGGTDAAAEPRRPAILLLVADDLGRSFVGAYGNDSVPSPNIDRLAAEGLRFGSAFTPTALCRPSRWAIYTGIAPHASGVAGFNRVPRESSLLHEVLRDNGYRTGLLAKFGSRVQDFQPFDFFLGNPDTEDGHDVNKLAEGARRFLAETRDEPFFLLVGFGDPHVPYPPQGYGTAEEMRVPAYLPDLPGVRTALTRYYAAIARLDRGVGLILEELERAGRADDTLVLFTSDHGPAFPFAKSTLYDAGVRVPLIARWPGRAPAGGVTDELISFLDIRPTLLDFAGIVDPESTHGRSILPLLRGEPFQGRDALLLTHTANFEGSYPMRAVRTPRYKYIRNLEPGRKFTARLEAQGSWDAMRDAARSDHELARRMARYEQRPAEELYDLDSDPAELDNRIDDPSLAAEAERLRVRLAQLMQATDDPLLDDASDP